jgi:O-methyltransferase
MTNAIDLYLDLLARALTRDLFEDNDEIAGVSSHPFGRTWKQRLGDRVGPVLRRAGYELVRKRPYDPEARALGRDWPARAETMAGLRRIANARACIESVLRDDVPGDIIETGVWRGGMCIFMRGVLKAHGVTDRSVWLADSFQGLPAVDPIRFPEVASAHVEKYDYLAVGLDDVRHNFKRYGLLDEQVRFIPGWFNESLPNAPVRELAVLRLDGDLYDSTSDALEGLYPKLSPDGYCIIDDYNVGVCRQAVHDYRRAHDITEPIEDIDGWAAFWRRRFA